MSRPKADEKRYSKTVKCATCGKKAILHRPNGKFCSSKCRVEAWWRAKYGGAKPEADPKHRREIKCANCGKAAIAHQSRRRFCSSKCRVEAWWLKKAASLGVKPSTLDAVSVGSLPEPE
jgi:endogenous inhibitor of DNA gyrase (YacG/DUF329 family)